MEMIDEAKLYEFEISHYNSVNETIVISAALTRFWGLIHRKAII